jgi:putative tryptophan/tyrosine transport system substrate-binding protein
MAQAELEKIQCFHERHGDRCQGVVASSPQISLFPLRPVTSEPASGFSVARTPDDFGDAFAKMHSENCDALFVPSDARVNRRIVEFANEWRLPAIYEAGDFVDMDGWMSYGPDFHEQFRKAAVYVDRILKGANPADLPVEQPTKFELEINLKTSKLLGVTIPDSILARADRVIE